MLNNFVIHTQNSHPALNFVYLLKATLPNPNLQKKFYTYICTVSANSILYVGEIPSYDV